MFCGTLCLSYCNLTGAANAHLENASEMQALSSPAAEALALVALAVLNAMNAGAGATSPGNARVAGEDLRVAAAARLRRTVVEGLSCLYLHGDTAWNAAEVMPALLARNTRRTLSIHTHTSCSWHTDTALVLGRGRLLVAARARAHPLAAVRERPLAARAPLFVVAQGIVMFILMDSPTNRIRVTPPSTVRFLVVRPNSLYRH